MNDIVQYHLRSAIQHAANARSVPGLVTEQLESLRRCVASIESCASAAGGYPFEGKVALYAATVRDEVQALPPLPCREDVKVAAADILGLLDAVARVIDLGEGL